MQMKIKQLTGSILIKTGLHIGAGNMEIHIGGTDSPVVKHPQTLQPYIPGSSLKGKMRALLELSCGVLKDKNPVSFKNLNEFDEQSQQYKDILNIIKLFGVSAGDNSDNLYDDFKNTPLIARLSFYDCEVKKASDDDIVSEVKAENSINRISGTADAPRFIERVPSGVRFEFKLILKEFDGDKTEELEKMLAKGLRLLEIDGIGGSGSRGYGKIEFEHLKWDGDDKEFKLPSIEELFPKK